MSYAPPMIPNLDIHHIIKADVSHVIKVKSSDIGDFYVQHLTLLAPDYVQLRITLYLPNEFPLLPPTDEYAFYHAEADVAADSEAEYDAVT